MYLRNGLVDENEAGQADIRSFGWFIAVFGDKRSNNVDIAEAYLRVGDIQGSSYGPNIGDFVGAARSYDRVADVLATLDHLGVQSSQVTLARANLRSRRADIAHQASQLDVARRLFQEAIAEFEALPEARLERV